MQAAIGISCCSRQSDRTPGIYGKDDREELRVIIAENCGLELRVIRACRVAWFALGVTWVPTLLVFLMDGQIFFSLSQMFAGSVFFQKLKILEWKIKILQ